MVLFFVEYLLFKFRHKCKAMLLYLHWNTIQKKIKHYYILNTFQVLFIALGLEHMYVSETCFCLEMLSNDY